MKTLIAILLALATPACSQVHFNVHAGIRSAKTMAPYSYGYGASITFGRKLDKPTTYNRPTSYTDVINCPKGLMHPSANRATTTWYCVY